MNGLLRHIKVIARIAKVFRINSTINAIEMMGAFRFLGL